MSPLPSRIRELNDQLRRNFVSAPGSIAGDFSILITTGVGALDERAFAQLIAIVEDYDSFDDGNDPYSEHDFGTIDHLGTRYFWKIDYYDRTKTAGSPDPADPNVTCRLLTIMRADEY